MTHLLSGDAEAFRTEEGRPVTQDEHARWVSVFGRLRSDGEIHRSDLAKALLRLGYAEPRDQDVSEALRVLTRYSTLDQFEFFRFVCLYEQTLHARFREEFDRFDRDGSGTIQASELHAVLANLGLHFRRGVVREIAGDVDEAGLDAGALSFGQFEKGVELLRHREGFLRSELREFRRVFQSFDHDHSQELSTAELASAMAWLGFPTSPEETRALYEQEDVDGTGNLSEREYLRCIRRVCDSEVEAIGRLLGRLGGSLPGRELEGLVRGLGYVAPPETVLEAAEAAGLPGGSASDGSKRALSACRFEAGVDELCLLLAGLRSRQSFSPADTREIEAAFRTHSREAEISTLLAGRALRWLGHDLPFQHLQHLVEEVSVDVYGPMDITMFAKLVRKCRDQETRRAVQTFKECDTRGAGRLGSAGQFRAFATLGCLDQKGCVPARTRQEQEGLDLGRFVALVQRHRERGVPAMRQNCGFGPCELRRLEERFRDFDEDGSGEISRQELMRLIEDLFPRYASALEWRPHLVALLSEIDADSSGSLDLPEFVSLMRRIHDQEDEESLSREVDALKLLRFSPEEVHDFRGLFLEADAAGQCRLTFGQVHRMVSRGCTLGDRASSLLEDFFAAAARKSDAASGADEDGSKRVDFVEFLQIMRQVIKARLTEI